MKIAKNTFTLLCEDVRNETGSKLSIMGTYEKDISVSDIPCTMPRLCFIIFLNGIKEDIVNIQLTLKSPKNDDVCLNLDNKPKKSAKGKDARFVVYLSPFKINGTGKACFEVRFNDAKKASITHEFSIKKIKA